LRVKTALLKRWYLVAESVDLSDAPLAVRRLSRVLVVWRSATGSLVAAPDRCPHREAPLSEGWVTDGCVVCPYHGWKFGDDGVCVEVPSSGAGKTVPPNAHLSTVLVSEQYGLVWICLGEPASGIPDMAAERDGAYRRINSGVDVWKVSATRMTDNFLDISHFPYVHIGTFGIEQNNDVPKIEMEQLDDDFFGYQYDVEVRNDDESGKAVSGLDADVIHRKMSTGFNLPFTVRSTIHYETGLDHLILLCSTPIDDVTSYFTFVIWRNDDHSADPEETIAFDRAIGAEDKAMLEKVKGVLPLDQRATVSVQSDKPSVEWRRRFAQMLG
ncbi:MAG: Rieske 2Fe-2S domain-containing protein, partial [Ilumatobacter sp.]